MGTSEELPFRTLRPWLLERFGRPVRRVSLDAGSSCPNRDGSKGFGGCVYCDVEGSGTGALRGGLELERQLRAGLERIRRGDARTGAIAYFQSYSNTYVEPRRLKEVLAVVEPWLGDPIVAVSVATRPDTLPESALEILAELGRRVPVWVELGLELADDALLERIRRFHSVQDFRDAVRRVHEVGLEVVGHAILGLPGDGREGARRTARVLAECGVEGVKVHQLMVLRRTVLERWWREGDAQPLDSGTYVQWLADFVELLDPAQVLHRITGDAAESELLAPLWDVSKGEVRALLADELRRRGTRQGSAFSEFRAGRECDRSSGTG